MRALGKAWLILLIAVPLTLAQVVERRGGLIAGHVRLPLLEFRGPGSADSVLRRTLWKPGNSSTIVMQTIVGGGLAVAVWIPAVGMMKKSDGLGEVFLIGVFSLIAEGVIPLGVYFSGEFTGGDGSYGMTLVSSLVGGGIALLPAIISGRGNGEEIFPPAVIGAAVGAIVGYHLFASPVYETGNQTPNHSGIPGGNVRVTVVSIRF